MSQQHETVLAAGLSKAQLMQAIRAALAQHIGLDVEASALPADTAGSSETDAAHIQWVHASEGEMIALQGLDKADGHLWEFCAALLPDERYAISRRHVHRRSPALENPDPCLLDAIWEDVVGAAQSWDVHNTTTAPSFITVSAAALSHGGLRAINDQSQAHSDAREETEYWRDLARSQSRLLKEQKSLGTGFNSDKDGDDVAQPSSPSAQVDTTSLKNLDQWATLNSDRIVVMPRAISAAKRSSYENPSFVYECLELLANEYRLTKLAQLDRNVFKDKCTALGLDVGGSVDPSRAGAAGDEYFVRWGGRKLWLDQHMGNGSARDPRFTLRIYYTWSEEDSKVIVGWLPSHLNNSKS
jgi:hypothetical protein